MKISRKTAKIGDKFHKLTILSLEYNENNKVLCQCDCGEEHLTPFYSLGKTISCGCHRRNFAKNHPKFQRKTHGMSNSRIYKIWDCMKDRCNKTWSDSYKNYGARGIKVCDDWLIFENFCKWAMENGYKENLTIDRKDPDIGYKPLNCRWITREEQIYTRRTDKNTSQYYGVSWHKQHRKWYVEIQYKYKTYYVGLFDNEIEAAKAYNVKAIELKGEKAHTNRVPE